MSDNDPSQPLTDAELEVIRSCVKQAKLFNEDDFPLAFGDRERLLAEVDWLRAALTALGRNERAAADRSLELQEENEHLRVENDELLAGNKYLSNRLGTQIEAHERTTQKLENAYAERALLFSELKRTVEGQTNE